MSDKGKVPAGKLVALLRGINVGNAKKVPMAELRALIEGLGYRDVKTLLNSGNVVFTAPGTTSRDAADRIEKGLVENIGVSARVFVITAAELSAVVRENPLLDVADNHSRLLVCFLANPKDRSRLTPLENRDWSPETMAVGKRAVYVWCPEGILASRAQAAIARALGDSVTARNWATVSKLRDLL